MRFADDGAVNRLGIFFFYDAQGVVDDYVTTLLDGLAPHFTEMAIVCNGELTDEGRAKLARYTGNITVRANQGFDAWAYKTAMDSYGWDALTEFDEIVLFNATIMGPVHPFSEMFDAMDKRDLDFWGITKFHKVPFDPFGRSPFGYLPEHIQSHFHAYRKSLVSSKEFQNYWDNLPPINSYEDSVGLHESLFTKRFADLGYAWDVYVNTNDLEGYTYGPINYAPKKPVQEKGCPIFKRRLFFQDYGDIIEQSVGNASLDLYEYLRDHTGYDTGLIWQNILRTINLADVVKTLHLNYVLPQDHTSYEPNPKHVALVFHLYYIDLLDSSLQYISSMPEGCDVIITVGSEEKACIVKERCEGMPYNIDVRVIENRGRDVSALLVGAGKDVLNYDLVCFAHDKKVTQIKPLSVGDGFAYKCFENILASKAYVANIIDQFEREPHLGVLMPNPPEHGNYFPVFTLSWGDNFDGTVQLLRDIHKTVPLDKKKEVIAPLGTMFWFRPKALSDGLLNHNWQYSDFPKEPNKIDGTILHYIERAYCYVAQANGYYSGYVFSDRYSRIELTNLAYTTRALTRCITDTWLMPTLPFTCDAIEHGKHFRNMIVRILRNCVSFIPGIGPKAIGLFDRIVRKIDRMHNHRRRQHLLSAYERQTRSK